MCKCNEEINVKIKLLHEDSKMPKKAHETDACYDVYATDLTYKEDGSIVYDLGFATEIPKGYVGIIVPRSSFTKTNWIMQNSPAQIDSSYTGSWKIRFRVLRTDIATPFPYRVGDRIAQITFSKVPTINFEVVEELSDTERGDGGFGSSGK